MVKHLPAMQETWVRSLGRERSPGEGNGNPLQYSCLENSMATVHGILQARILEWVCHFLLQGIFPDPGVEPRSPALEADTLTSEPPGKPDARLTEKLNVYI